GAAFPRRPGGPPRGGPQGLRRAGLRREARGREIVAPRRNRTDDRDVQVGREPQECLSGPLRSAPVADQSQKLDREAPGELVLACAGDPARLEVGQYGIESHAREVAAVALRLVGSGARERVCQDHRRERDARRLLVLVDAYPDVLMDAHVTGLAPSRPRTGGHTLAA